MITGGQTANNLVFNYQNASATAPTITSIDPISANPAMKGKMTVSGINFGSDVSKIKAYLSNSTVSKIYQLQVLTVQSSLIELGLPGGLAGQYFLEMSHTDLGNFGVVAGASVQFSYELSISSISPSSGSYYGGTLLTINGVNFVNDLTITQVYIGFSLNWNCKIESISSTLIKCRTPNISSEYTPGTPVDVVVTSRLII